MHDKAPPEFQTRHLLARRLMPDDLSDICLMHGDPRVMASLGGVRSASRSREYLATNLAHWDRFGVGLWMLRHAAGNFVGRAGLRHVTINGKDEVELAYALMPEYWGRGIATEVALTLIEVAFVRLRLPSVVIYTLPDNEASRRVAEKAGFRLEGSADIDGLRHVVYRRHAPLPLRGRS